MHRWDLFSSDICPTTLGWGGGQGSGSLQSPLYAHPHSQILSLMSASDHQFFIHSHPLHKKPRPPGSSHLSPHDSTFSFLTLLPCSPQLLRPELGLLWYWWGLGFRSLMSYVPPKAGLFSSRLRERKCRDGLVWGSRRAAHHLALSVSWGIPATST